MNAVKHLVWAAGLTVAMLGGAAGQAKATDYVSAVVRNPSNDKIHYQIKWGENGTWKDYTLEPGFRRFHAFEMEADGSAPTLYVRFDCVANDKDITYKSYNLTTWEVTDPWKGQPFVFQWDGRLLDLYKD